MLIPNGQPARPPAGTELPASTAPDSVAAALAMAEASLGYLRDPGYSVLDVSIKLGYKTARIFSQHWVSVFGLTPARVRTRLTDEAAIEGVMRWLGASDDDSSLADDSGHPPGRNGTRRLRQRSAEPN